MTDIQDFIHDVKQPLSVIKGFAYLALQSVLKDPAKAQEYLRKIDEQADIMTKQLNELSDAAKIKHDQ